MRLHLVYYSIMANRQKKIDLKRIKWLMIFSQALLLVFTVQWMVGQYNEQQAQLKQNLTELFTDVQQKITDSLILTHVVRPGYVNMAVASSLPANVAPQDSPSVKISQDGLSHILSGTRISSGEERKLFGMDTIVFNEYFTSEMRHNGWNFNAQWINNADSNKRAGVIFIRSNFFTNANGVEIDNYRWYLAGRLLPQFLFALILLLLTAAAFLFTFRGLSAQIRLGQMKDDFISNMSHELKTPIATVKVALEALHNYNVIDNPTLGREYIGMASAEMDRLELMATRVLNTSLMESGRIDLQRESCDLRQLVDDVLLAMQLRLKQHGATVSFTHSGRSFGVSIDRLHTQGVLVNLIDNSLKYGPANVHVNIDLTEEYGAVKLALTDNGPGIPEEYREKVFEKFFRVPTGNRHNTKGYGLGLSYAAQVMRLHNGSINVDNVAEGGCMFTLTF
jgi:signal transduction histidine kinase